MKGSGRAGFRKVSKPVATVPEPSENEMNKVTEEERPRGIQDTLPDPQKGKKRTRRQSTSAVPLPSSSSMTAAASTASVPLNSSIDHETNDAHHSSKRKKKSLGNDSQIQINSSPREKEKTKAYYPKIAFDPHGVIKILKDNYSPVVNRRKSDQKTRRSSRGGGSGSSSGDGIIDFSHDLITTTLVNQICQQELNGLKSSFSDDDRYKTKDSVTVHLYAILEDLTSIVADNLPPDIVFTPELSSREFQQIEQMNEVLKNLQTQYETLKQYSEDAQLLFSEWGVLTDEDVADIPSSSSSHPAKPLEDIQRYENQLEQLTQTINGLLDGLDGVARDINIAKDTQEKLYSAHHKERFSSQSSPSHSPSDTPKARQKIPSDTRDLLKGYPK